MQVMLNIPDSLVEQLTADGKDPAREALEALAVDGYRNRRLFEEDIRVMLGYQTRMQVHALLKEHNVDLNFTVEDFEHDVATLDRLFGKPVAV
jgi:predicted HTH domain antitoxin